MSWRTEYLRACKGRDAHEQADLDLYNAYTRLADRTAAAEAAAKGQRADEVPAEAPTESLVRARTGRGTSSGSSAPDRRDSASTETNIGQLKADLSEAQRSRVTLQARLKNCTDELEQLRTRTTGDGRRIHGLSLERNTLVVKVRDRDAELKGKAKLLEDIQDEMMTLNLQLNMAEARSADLAAENKDLVARLMAWKGQQADAVNTASKYS